MLNIFAVDFDYTNKIEFKNFFSGYESVRKAYESGKSYSYDGVYDSRYGE